MNTENKARALKIVILGRPNVGKSTLFNRLIGRKRALVHDVAGVTRDRIIEKAVWIYNKKNYNFEIIDTGGVGGEHFKDEILTQVQIALQEADLALFIVDARSGIIPADMEVLKTLRASTKNHKKLPLIGVMNKADHEGLEHLSSDFYKLGLDKIMPISAEHNRGVEFLKEEIIKDTRAEPMEEELLADKPPCISIVGKPNVGKSTLVNTVLSENRMVVSPIAGTTSDAIDLSVTLDGHEVTLIDTAGIRRKSKTEQGLEVLSVVQTRKTLERSDLAILVLDGEKGITDQDEKIGGLIEDAGCSVIIAVNKWDTQAKNKGFSKEDAAKRIRAAARFLKYAPIVFISALKNEGIDGLGDLAIEILNQKKVMITTHDLTTWFKHEATVHNPQDAKFYLTHQVSQKPPSFICYVSDPRKIHYSLKRHLVNAMRDQWGFMGSPVWIKFVKSSNSPKKPKESYQSV